MSDDRDIIDVEAEEIEDSDCLPAVIEARIASERPLNNSSKDTRTRAEKREAETDELGRTWRDRRLDENAERRCAAHLSDGSGEQCRKWAVRGGKTCQTHGSGTKAAKLKARERLDNAADRMVAHLLTLARFAESEATQLKAIDSALDRTLGKATQSVVLSQGEAPWETVFETIGGSPPEPWTDTGHYGSAGQSSSLSTPPEPDPATQTPPSAQAEPRDNAGSPVQGVADTDSSEGSESSPSESPPSPLARAERRSRQSQARERHITGDDAIRAANAANRAAGVWDEQLALESRHKRYPRP